MLENEGHTVIQKGRTNIKYYVKDLKLRTPEKQNILKEYAK